MGATSRIGHVTRLFVDVRGNFTLSDNFIQDDFARDKSLRFHLRNERVYIEATNSFPSMIRCPRRYFWHDQLKSYSFQV